MNPSEFRIKAGKARCAVPARKAGGTFANLNAFGLAKNSVASAATGTAQRAVPTILSTLGQTILWITLTSALTFQSLAAAQTDWASLEANGRLSYKALPAGDRIPDFSHAGYGGGGVKIPVVPVEKTVAPSGGDDSDAIQSAINSVAALPATAGFRGAVLLAPGTFHCAKEISLFQSGIVLRGSGTDANGTIIEMTGEPHTCVNLAGGAVKYPLANPAATFPITDTYVPASALSVSVQNASGLAAGDTVLIRWVRSAKWIHRLGMDTLVRNGKPQTWLEADSPVAFERTLVSIQGDRLTLNAPLTDAIDTTLLAPGTAVVCKIPPPKRLSQCGLESLRINSLPPSGTLVAKNNLGVLLDNCEDCWVKNVEMHDTLGNVRVMQQGRRITLEAVAAVHTATVAKGAGYPSDFTLRGSQTLIDRCTSTGDGSFFVATMNADAALNVVLHCRFLGAGAIQPHMRWSTGLLIDNCELLKGKIDLINRGTSGSGHGWSIAWGVAWNCAAKELNIQQPPGAMNWCVGCTGELTPEKLKTGKGPPPSGPWLASPGAPVEPASLYLAQLRDRLGIPALSNIGY